MTQKIKRALALLIALLLAMPTFAYANETVDESVMIETMDEEQQIPGDEDELPVEEAEIDLSDEEPESTNEPAEETASQPEAAPAAAFDQAVCVKGAQLPEGTRIALYDIYNPGVYPIDATLNADDGSVTFALVDMNVYDLFTVEPLPEEEPAQEPVGEATDALVNAPSEILVLPAINELIYTGEAQALVSGEGWLYSLDGVNYSEQAPNGFNVPIKIYFTADITLTDTWIPRYSMERRIIA